MKHFLPLLLILLLLPMNLWAATYYLRADGSVAAADKANATSCAAAASAMNMTQHNAATFAVGDTIVVCGDGGIFTDAAFIPPTSGEAGGVGHTITYNASGYPRIDGAAGAGTTATLARNYITYNGLMFTGERALTTFMVNITGTNQTFNYCIFTKNRTVTTDAYTSPALNISVATNVVLNNCIVTDNNRTAIWIKSAATVTMRNCIVTGNAQYYGNGIATNNAGTTLDIDYCILIGNSFDTANQLIAYTTSTITDGGHNITTLSPGFVNQKYGTGIIGFGIDDFQTTSYVTNAIAVAAAYGVHISVFPIIASTGVVQNAAAIAILQAAFDGGNDIGTHGWSHQTQTLVNGMDIRYVGAAAAATMTISGNTLTTATTGGVDDLSIDLTNASYNTMVELVAYIDGLANYTCTKHASADSYSLSKALADVASQDIKTGAYTAVKEATRMMNAEVGDSKTWLEANVTGLTVTSHSYPTGLYNATVIAALQALGHLGARAVETRVTPLTYSLDSIYLYGSYGVLASKYCKGAEATTRAAVRHLIALVKGTGAYVQLYGHTAADCSIADLGYLINEVQLAGIPFLNVKEASASIRADHTSADGDLTWTKTYTNISDYHLKAGSPAINAGVSVGLVSDYSGGTVPKGSAPDIGAYEFGAGYQMIWGGTLLLGGMGIDADRGVLLRQFPAMEGF
jgi:hypothetical protein